MKASHPNVKTMAPGVPFLRTLVAACMNGSLGIHFPSGDRDYSAATIYVPTRRAARALAHAFAEALQPRAVLLPRIIPLGDASDLEERAILAGVGFSGDADMMPAIGELERRLLLARLVEGWRTSQDFRALEDRADGFSLGGGFADSFALAGDLAGLIDEFAIEGIDWGRVGNLTQGQFDEYWSLTRSFLQIAGEHWPQILTERNALDPAERLNRLLRAEARRLKRDCPVTPIIAAGSTGTVPATAELLAAIARLPNGVVLLPGLDTGMDESAWTLVADHVGGGMDTQPGQSQAALKRLLSRLLIDRSDVETIGEASAPLLARSAIVNASALPASATDTWPDMRKAFLPDIPQALQCVCVLEADDERVEALAIALALREVLEKPDQTAALVTPDRVLAERVSAELRRWDVVADDSSGVALAVTPLGTFGRLILNAMAENCTPLAVMAVLTHPCIVAGMDSADRMEAVQALELAGLRGHDLAPGIAGLAAGLENAHKRVTHRHAAPPVKRVQPVALDKAAALLSSFVAAVQPLAALQEETHPLRAFVQAHREALDSLAGERASTGADAVALARVFDDLSAVTSDPHLSLADYAALFGMLLAESVVAPAQPVQGRIKIWGLLEARLMEAERVVLGGLNEGTWPPETRMDPFLNRAMRTELGLSSPERRIGQSAHDFIEAMGAHEVIITRARSVEGTPMVASRFLRRLDAFVGADAARSMRERGETLLNGALAMDQSAAIPAAPRPDPRPPKHMQPLSLSVTEIPTLNRDPYAIYARHVLGLAPLAPLQAGIDASDRGSLIHDIMAAFIETTAAGWPERPLDDLLALGRESFAPLAGSEQVRAFWWPVFERVARWFVEWEGARRHAINQSKVEISGTLSLPLADGATFRLSARADRIDLLADGSLAVIDYKTGAPPSGKTVHRGLEPQLTLMAAMAVKGAFNAVPAGPVSHIAYVRLGANPEEIMILPGKDDVSIEDMAQRHIRTLMAMLDRLRSGVDGYISRRMPEKMGDGGDYDHLARSREWLAEADD